MSQRLLIIQVIVIAGIHDRGSGGWSYFCKDSFRLRPVVHRERAYEYDILKENVLMNI